jgi:outer membrane protein assembly factor BamC
MTDLRFTSRFAALLLAGVVVAGCSSPSPTQVDYKSDSKSKEVSLAIPPNMLDETSDQRSLPPQGGTTSLSALEQVQQTAPKTDTNTVIPPVAGMHIQRDGTESWLVIDNKSPDDVWPQVRRFWQEQGFLLVVDQRDKHLMETDWNETRPQINQGLIRNTLTKAMGNSYVAAERNKYRTRLETAPDGGTYVFISQKGLTEQVTGVNNDQTEWRPSPNDPALETEYLKRMMAALGRADSQGQLAAAQPASGAQVASTDPAAGVPAKPAAAQTGTAAIAAQNVTQSGQSALPGDQSSAGDPTSSTQLTLNESYDQAWLRVGLALDRSNFTVDDRDRNRGLYFVRYVDPKDLSSDEQGFWSQIFHGRKEKEAKVYRVNVRAITEDQTRVAVVDDKGAIDTSQPAKEIMGLVIYQLR